MPASGGSRIRQDEDSAAPKGSGGSAWACRFTVCSDQGGSMAHAPREQGTRKPSDRRYGWLLSFAGAQANSEDAPISSLEQMVR
jgi:hypothetical protein